LEFWGYLVVKVHSPSGQQLSNRKPPPGKDIVLLQLLLSLPLQEVIRNSTYCILSGTH